MDSEILAANEAFYDAFRTDDALAMDSLWARHAPVACVHPGWRALIGREAVMASWRAILAAGSPPIRCEAPRVQRIGDVAYVICTERVGEGRLVATNLFVREDGRWLLAHHHAGPVAEREESTPPARGPLN